MTLTNKLKNYILSDCDMDIVGIASAAALNGEPKGHRPQDILPGAKSIIVFGRKLADGVIQSQFRYFESNMAAAQSSYAAFGSDLAVNFLLYNETFEIAQYVETQYNTVATPVPFNTMQGMMWDNVPGAYFADPYGQGMPLNVAQAALAAGLGEYGWSNRFLTPEFGPRIMLSAVITTLELEADAPYAGEQLCDPEKCGICSKLCPTGALCAECKTLSVEGKSCTVSKLNANACTVAEMGFRKEFQGRIPVPDQIMHNDPTDEELADAFAKKPLNPLAVDHYPRYFCDRCMIYCPVGKWKERFQDTGFSAFDPETKEFGTLIETVDAMADRGNALELEKEKAARGK